MNVADIPQHGPMFTALPAIGGDGKRIPDMYVPHVQVMVTEYGIQKLFWKSTGGSKPYGEAMSDAWQASTTYGKYLSRR